MGRGERPKAGAEPTAPMDGRWRASSRMQKRSRPDDMSEAGTITVRVHPKLLNAASRVLRQVGVNTSDAITMFLKHVVLHGGLPFDVAVPNGKARRARRERGTPAQQAETRGRPRENDPLAPA